MKKRIVLCLLALALLSVMTGCGKKKDADPLTVTLCMSTAVRWIPR